MHVVESLSDADLGDPRSFAWTGRRPLWQILAANTWEHYQEHLAGIRAWLDQQQGG